MPNSKLAAFPPCRLATRFSAQRLGSSQVAKLSLRHGDSIKNLVPFCTRHWLRWLFAVHIAFRFPQCDEQIPGRLALYASPALRYQHKYQGSPSLVAFYPRSPARLFKTRYGDQRLRDGPHQCQPQRQLQTPKQTRTGMQCQ